MDFFCFFNEGSLHGGHILFLFPEAFHILRIFLQAKGFDFKGGEGPFFKSCVYLKEFITTQFLRRVTARSPGELPQDLGRIPKTLLFGFGDSALNLPSSGASRAWSCSSALSNFHIPGTYSSNPADGQNHQSFWSQTKLLNK